jgi:hypothetical protein
MPTTNPHELVEQNPELRDESPETNHLSHGRTAASKYFKTSDRTPFFETVLLVLYSSFRAI